jgi:diaminohydroxyphosphoribosylaminopyrimidine deaminase/5-amino-6-(5-phosphoribosylamino)uracil reductase
VIVSGGLSLSPTLPLFKKSGAPLLMVCCEKASAERRRFFSQFGTVIVCGRQELDVPKLVQILTTKYRAHTLLCEGGPTLNDAFFRAGLVDELYITLCPRIVGGRKAPSLVEGIGIPKLSRARKGRLASCRRGQTEWFLRYLFD